jgi:hypothetical protein
LAAFLEQLNAAASPVWTSKCDVWPVVDFAEFDPDELDAPPGSATHAMGCYIDLLPRIAQRWGQPDYAVAGCKQMCIQLYGVPLRCCRVDLIVRQAVIGQSLPASNPMSLGITAYLTACGPSEFDADNTLGDALVAFGDALLSNSTLK